MNNPTIVPSSSDRGIALVVVLLLMAVLSGLATGFAMNGHIEAQMGNNEVSYAGARAAAEAGLNRAIVEILADTTTNFLAGQDGAVDAGNALAAVNADNGSLAFLLGGAGPYALDANGEYTYAIEILDDDDDSLYQTALTAAQVATMGEDDNIYTNTNDRLILRAIGYGPNGTVVRLARVLDNVDTTELPTTTTTLSNPAILVDGSLDISGNITVTGAEGNIHSNGDLTISGAAADVDGDATSTGTFDANDNWEAGGSFGGGRPTINVPDIHASSYIGHADYKLTSGGAIQSYDAVTSTWSDCTTAACAASGWSYDAASGWSVSGNSVISGTFYAETNVTISGSPGKKGAEIAFSVIATGSITVSGTPKFKPENDAKIQFVTDKDLVMSGNVDLDDPTAVEGQILVREQMSISGNPEFQGRIVVGNETSTDGSPISSNSVSGNPTITYNGTLDAIETTITDPGGTTYVNNVSGWMEQ